MSRTVTSRVHGNCRTDQCDVFTSLHLASSSHANRDPQVRRGPGYAQPLPLNAIHYKP